MLLCLFGLGLAADPYGVVLRTLAMTASDEYAIGREYSTMRAWMVGTWANPEQQTRVERIARELVAASDRPDVVINVTLLDTPEINASAYPGGFLLVNRGTLELLDDGQLAFVIGHEISHAILRHGVNAMNLQAATKSVAALRTSRAAEDRKAAAQQANDLQLMTASYSRQQEHEADLYGMLYAVRAGWPAAASVSALEGLRDSVGGEIPAARAATAGHPLYADRIDQLKRGQSGIQATLHQFEAGVGFMRAGRPATAVVAFQQFLTLFPHSNQGWANLGAAWISQIKPAADDPWRDVLPLHTSSGQRVRGADDGPARERARDALAHALQIDPYDPVALGLLGVLARRDGSLVEARLLLERALALSPDAAPLLVDLGNVAAQQGEVKEALALWERATGLAANQVEPLLNKAVLMEREGKKKPAIVAWNVVAALPGWEDEAAAHLETLGKKRERGPERPPPGLEALVVGKAKLAVRGPVDDAVAALGAPSVDDTSLGEGFRYVAWEELGVEAVVQDGRVLEWFVYGEGITTVKGIGIGATAEALLGVYGAPTDSFELDSIRGYEWAPIGLGVTLVGGEVSELDLYIPE